MFKQYMMWMAKGGMGVGALGMIFGLFGILTGGFDSMVNNMMLFSASFWFTIIMAVVKLVLVMFGVDDGDDKQ